MNVSLTPELENLVNNKVESGMYHSASEVIREGLRLLKEQDELREIRHQELRREIARAVEQAERGEVVSGDDMFKALRERNRKMNVKTGRTRNKAEQSL
jgi:antitoxin ParD1/3/4